MLCAKVEEQPEKSEAEKEKQQLTYVWDLPPRMVSCHWHVCGFLCVVRKRKMTINLAGTHHAPNIAACAKVPEKCEAKKEKQQLTCAWFTPSTMVYRHSGHLLVCGFLCVARKRKMGINLAGTHYACNINAFAA